MIGMELAMGIAIIIPIYNTEKYLKECVDSVLRQTIPFQQIILMDDGSTDGSYLLAQRYASEYENITLVSQENVGLGATRNRALELVKEDYVMFLDSDDYLVETTVEILSEEIRKTPVNALYFDAFVKNQMQNFHKTARYDRKGKVPENLMSGKEYFMTCFPHCYVVSSCLAVFQTEFLRKNKITFAEVRAYEDEVFSFLVMMCAKWVRYIPAKLYVRRYRENSIMTTRITSAKWIALCKCYTMNWEYIESHVKEFSQAEIMKMKVYFMQKYMSIKRCFSELTQDEKESVKEIFFDMQNCFCQGISKLGECIKVEDDPYMYRWYCNFLFDLTEEDHIVADFVKKDVYQKTIVELYKDTLKKKLAVLPFHLRNKTIGIYGTGYHTEQLLKWYRELCGPIMCTIYYIDTYKESYVEKYNNSDVINVCDIDGLIDEIVISSNEYEYQMKKTITELYGNKYKTHVFYEEEKNIIFVDYEKFCGIHIL